MPEKNKAILKKANAKITERDHEGFLSFCADDIEWTTVGAETLRGKEALRAWMAKEYVEPPDFSVTTLIEEGDYLTAIGDIMVKDDAGKKIRHSYCDVWRFRDDKMVELRAFVIENQAP